VRFAEHVVASGKIQMNQERIESLINLETTPELKKETS